MGDWFMAQLSMGRISPMIEHQISMEQVKEYLHRLKAGDIIGKIVVGID
jgi:D-arabinose 1-dehydrogenase-like Zn-dependent alcohol dehydrogenase